MISLPLFGPHYPEDEPEFDPSKPALDQEWVERLCVQDLNHLVNLQANKPDEYMACQQAAILRRLLIQDLLSLANKEYGLNLVFRLRGEDIRKAVRDGDGVTEYFPGIRGLDPRPALVRGDEVTSYGLGRFKNAAIWCKDGHLMRVEQAVLFVANVLGGVHAGVSEPSKSEKELITKFGLHRIHMMSQYAQMHFIYWVQYDIAGSVIDACADLFNTISKNRDYGDMRIDDPFPDMAWNSFQDY